ncbi:MAG: type II CRISPR RNA-guided endonuclease Cas9 [Alphaproteobacteria bacterium]
MSSHYRLGIDIGTNSLGWCALHLDAQGRPDGILDAGAGIFPDSRDPKSGTSLASERRLARGMRRRRDRYLKRRSRVMEALVHHGLMPADPVERKALERLDPYELRARGLDQALGPHEFGRALFHLDQRRGFKSNRKTDKDEKETGQMKRAISELDRRIAESGARTLGEYLHRRRRKNKPVRARPGVGFYPSRAMYEAEFDTLWAAQAPHHPRLDAAARDEIRDAIFFQRPLRPVAPGNCELEPEEKRAPLALPLSQRFRMYQELNNLRVVLPDQSQRRLTMAERDRVFARLERQKTLTFNAIRRLIGLDSDTRFNLEDGKRKALNGDKTGTLLVAVKDKDTKKDKDIFGPRWWDLDAARQDAIVETILAAEDEDALAARAETEWGCDAEAARRLADVRLVQGYGRLGRRAMSKIVPIMRDQGLNYAEAAAEAGYHHSDRRPDELRDALPYYGEALRRYTAGGSDRPEDDDEKRYGKLANPTVHVGLNRLRKLVNALIAEYGRPNEIVVELARELKLGEQRKSEERDKQAANEQRNRRIAGEIEALGEDVTGENIRRYKLWEELGEIHDRRCVYTGQTIAGRMLFSAEVEIEHILPFRRTLDDSMANRTLSLRRANRDKGARSPFEAFGHNPPGYDYDAILRRAESLPKNKRWRFAPDAMEKFEGDHDFIARQLTDTAYLARTTREYLTHVCPAEQVWVTPGRLTALLRGKWGLNGLLPDSNWANVAQEKNRKDHRHHAIDAFVVGVTDRGLLQRVARADEHTRDRLIGTMPDPWEGFREDLGGALARVVVSHKPDHGREGQLHEETAYGIVADPEKADGYNLVFRKAFAGLTEGEMKRIRDPALRAALLDHVAAGKAAGRSLKQALESFRWPAGSERRLRHVRLLKKEAKLIGIRGRDGTPYKALIPGDNHHIDIYELPNGKWAGEGVSVFEANQPGRTDAWRRAFPDARLVMRVHKGDLVKMEHEGGEHIFRVVKLAAANKVLWLSGHNESGDLQKRHDDADDPFRWTFVSFGKLKGRRARKVHVDALGRVRDPGPPD